MSKLERQFPAIKGLMWHRTQFYSFFLPMDWHQFFWADDRLGQIHGPDPNDLSTVFTVMMSDLNTVIEPDDIDILSAGFFEAVEALPACLIEEHSQRAIGQLIQVEAKYTFDECGHTRKRWQQILYHESRQIVFTAQGATPERYAYWLPWFYEAMMTKRVHSHMPATPY